MSKSVSARPAPFSIRLTADEKRTLERRAGKTPLGSYIKSQLFPGRLEPVQIAQALALLGRSEMAASLRELSRLAGMGALPVTPETNTALVEACRHVAEIKTLLMAALRIKED